jgi:hypothetical protein
MRFLGHRTSPLQRVKRRIDLMRQERLKSFELYLTYVSGKSGPAMGDPSGLSNG